MAVSPLSRAGLPEERSAHAAAQPSQARRSRLAEHGATRRAHGLDGENRVAQWEFQQARPPSEFSRPAPDPAPSHWTTDSRDSGLSEISASRQSACNVPIRRVFARSNLPL